MTERPAYWQEACRVLSGRDAVMARLMRRFPHEHLKGGGDAFVTLYRAVVGQQISLKAADSIRARVETRIGRITPDNLLRRRHATLRQCGLSENKVVFLKGIARFFIDEKVTAEYWDRHGFDELRNQLLALKGIGEWTFEMFAIFYLQHPDVYPVGDVGLLNAIQANYGNGGKLDRRQILALGEAWSPWRTVATWYLWRCIDPDPVFY